MNTVDIPTLLAKGAAVCLVKFDPEFGVGVQAFFDERQMLLRRLKTAADAQSATGRRFLEEIISEARGLQVAFYPASAPKLRRGKPVRAKERRPVYHTGRQA